MGTQKDRMFAGELYIADDPDLAEDNHRAMALLKRLNATPASEGEPRWRLLEELLGSIGEGSDI